MKKLLTFLVLCTTSATIAQTTMNIYQNNGSVLQIPVSSIDSITFTVGNPGQLATLTTLPIGNIVSTSATSGGNITNNGGTAVTQRGVVWSTSPNPTTANSQSSDGSGTGNYTSNLTGLTANTTYYVRAYATNSAGTAYGNELSFTTTGGAGSITALNCNSATNSGTLAAGTAASGVSSSVPYTGGNGGTHNGQTVTSTGVTGLTATLSAGSFANGSGSVIYTITGTPATSGSANFALNIGGQNCTLSRTVNAGSGIVSNPGAGVTYGGVNYPTVVLGNGQEWMAQNLNTSQYNDGTPITLVTNNSQWDANYNNGSTLPMMCWYNNDQATYTANTYGALYNWFAVSPTTNGNRNVCPVGWHVPTDTEWTVLTDYLGGLSVAGGKMKSTGTQYWLSPNAAATNESGFSGLPGSYRNDNGTWGLIGDNGHWWSSTENTTGVAYYRTLNSSNGIAGRFSIVKTSGHSVRCLRD